MKFRHSKLLRNVLLAGSFLLMATIGISGSAHAQRNYVSQPVKNKINRQVHHMSYRNRLEQLFVVELGNNNYSNRKYIRTYHPGGVLLMGNNFTTRHGTKNRIKSMQRASKHNLLVGTDVEGGQVNRLANIYPHPHYLSPSKEYKDHGMKGIRKEYSSIGRNMNNLGLNWDYAPDADPSNGYMSFRTVKRGPYTTAKYVKNAINSLQYHDVAATAKHFPGYRGGSDTDFTPTYSHINKRTYKRDLIPFIKGAVKGNSDSIITNSVIFKRISHKPAMMTKAIIMPLHNRFKGVIVTDSLQTGAVRHFIANHNGSADYNALKAGNTMIMSSDLPSKISHLVKDMHKGYLSKRLINNDVYRVLVMKYKLGLKY